MDTTEVLELAHTIQQSHPYAKVYPYFLGKAKPLIIGMVGPTLSLTQVWVNYAEDTDWQQLQTTDLQYEDHGYFKHVIMPRPSSQCLVWLTYSDGQQILCLATPQKRSTSSEQTAYNETFWLYSSLCALGLTNEHAEQVQKVATWRFFRHTLELADHYLRDYGPEAAARLCEQSKNASTQPRQVAELHHYARMAILPAKAVAPVFKAAATLVERLPQAVQMYITREIKRAYWSPEGLKAWSTQHAGGAVKFWFVPQGTTCFLGGAYTGSPPAVAYISPGHTEFQDISPTVRPDTMVPAASLLFTETNESPVLFRLTYNHGVRFVGFLFTKASSVPTAYTDYIAALTDYWRLHATLPLNQIRSLWPVTGTSFVYAIVAIAKLMQEKPFDQKAVQTLLKEVPADQHAFIMDTAAVLTGSPLLAPHWAVPIAKRKLAPEPALAHAKVLVWCGPEPLPQIDCWLQDKEGPQFIRTEYLRDDQEHSLMQLWVHVNTAETLVRLTHSNRTDWRLLVPELNNTAHHERSYALLQQARLAALRLEPATTEAIWAISALESYNAYRLAQQLLTLHTRELAIGWAERDSKQFLGHVHPDRRAIVIEAAKKLLVKQLVAPSASSVEGTLAFIREHRRQR